MTTTTEAMRAPFEDAYRTDGCVSDAISLARRADGEYDQALTRLCFKWFCKGQAALSQQSVPEGYVLVPVNITKEMAWELENNIAEPIPACEVHRINWHDAYKAMLAATPTPTGDA